MTEAGIESVEPTPAGYKVVLHLVGEGGDVRLESRWKDRDGRPTIVEASRVHEEPVVSGADAPLEGRAAAGARILPALPVLRRHPG